MNVEKRLENYFKELATEEEISIEDAKRITKSEWGKLGLRGYGIFLENGIEVVERIDDMLIYDNDLEAGEQLKKDFENGIVDVNIIDKSEYPQFYPLNCYHIIDNKVNRDKLNEYIERNKEL